MNKSDKAIAFGIGLCALLPSVSNAQDSVRIQREQRQEQQPVVILPGQILAQAQSTPTPPGPCNLRCPAGQTCVWIEPIPGKPFREICAPSHTGLPAPETNLDQAWTNINNFAYVFITDRKTQHVFYAFFQIGGANSNGFFDLGAPPSNAPGDPIAITSPAAVSAPGTGFIFLSVANRDGTVCLNQGHDFPETWTGWAC